MGTDIRKKGKMEKVIEFVERMKKVQEKAGVALRKMQEEMKQQADRGRIKEKEWKKGDKVMLSMKDLVVKDRLVKKLVDWYIVLYTIEEVLLTNAVKLQLPTSMRILQIRYSLVVIFKLNSVPGVQYKNVMMLDNGKYQ